jgi:transcriptional regulator with XRE-family HTH domain
LSLQLDAQKVLDARDRLGLSQEDVAKRTGLSPVTVARAEHGDPIRPLSARRLARGLNLKVEDLYTPRGEGVALTK